MEQDPRFDIYMLGKDKHIIRLFTDVSIFVAEIMYGGRRDEFDMAIMHHGWAGSNPAWASFTPVVIMHHGELIRHDQLAFLIELV